MLRTNHPNRSIFSFLLLCVLLIPTSALATSDKLLVLGDSLSAGYGIPEGKGWVSLFQQKVNEAELDIKIINDSISGDTTAGGLARLQKTLTSINPQWVIIELGGNDGLRGQSLKAMLKNLESMIALCRKSGAQPILIGMKLPPNYGKKYTQRFEQTYLTVAENTQTPLLPFLLEEIGGKEQLMQKDRIHPNTNAQPIITNNVWLFMEPYLRGE